MRVAIVVDWLTDAGGAEYVFAEALRAFPGAEIHSLVDQMSDADHERLGIPRARVSWLQGVVGRSGNYRPWLPLMPAAARSLSVSAADVVLAISHAVAQHVRVPRPRAGAAAPKLLCLSLSPMRYAWDLREQYLAESGLNRGVRGVLARALLARMRAVDLEASRRVDAYAAISRHIADRVRRAYGRESTIIHPPVDTEFYTPTPALLESEVPSSNSQPPTPNSKLSYFVTASRFVPYKRVDLIVRAFAALPERRLVVIGDGPDAAKVRAAATVHGRAAPNVEFTGHLTREALRERLRGARAFIFAAQEDFGIAPVEAQACGVPVIAYGTGGLAETVAPLGAASPTGVHFAEQTEAAILDAVRRFEASGGAITARACRERAERYSALRFRAALTAWVARECAARAD